MSPLADVVASIMTAENEGDRRRSTVGRFRNIVVFRRTGGGWRCFAWQVTRLESG